MGQEFDRATNPAATNAELLSRPSVARLTAATLRGLREQLRDVTAADVSSKITIVPAGESDAAIPLLTQAHGVIAVTRLRHGDRDAAAAFRQQLTELEVPLLGLVVNAVRPSDGHHYAYSDYYYAPPDKGGKRGKPKKRGRRLFGKRPRADAA